MENLPKRKPLRLSGYNYSQNGVYHITICVKDMKCILSTITPVGVGVPDDPQIGVPDDPQIGVPDDPQISLTDYGRIVANRINEMNRIYKNITVIKYIIMPNHLHILLRIENEGGTSRTPSPTSTLISRYVSTIKRMTNKEIGEKIWQRGYYDHIIRDENDYLYHIQYIEENPKKWLMGKDEYYS